MSKLVTTGLLSIFLLLTACGGGGGGGDTSGGGGGSELDTTPDNVSFTAEFDVALNTLIDSQAVLVTGINSPINVSISGGLFSVDGAEFSNQITAVNNGQSIVVRLASSANFGSTTAATLTLGDVSAVFEVTTLEDTQAPLVELDFPSANAITELSSLTLRGRAQDPEGNAITAVLVNGLAASSDDGFATWQITVPLEEGANSLSIEAEDASLNRSELVESPNIIRQSVFTRFIEGLGVDVSSNRAYIIESDGQGALIEVNLASSQLKVVSPPQNPGLEDANSIFVVNTELCQAVLPGTLNCAVSHNNDAVIAFDLDSGTRAVMVSDDRGSGGNLSIVNDLFIDTNADCFGFSPCVLLTDRGNGNDTLYAVDLSSGDRSVISNNNRGSGPSLSSPANPLLVDPDICLTVLDEVGECALVASGFSSSKSIFAVDLDTGRRAELAGGSRGNGVAFSAIEFVLAPASSCSSVAIETTHCALAIQNRSPRGLLALDLLTGDRADFASEARAQGPTFSARHIKLDETNQRALLVDSDLETLVAVDLATGDRELLPDNRLGSGPSLSSESGVEFLPSAVCESLFADPGECVLSFNDGSILTVDLASGNRVELSGLQRGSGPSFSALKGVHQVAAGHCGEVSPTTEICALAIDSSADRVVAVDLLSGDRALIAGSDRGTGPDLADLSALAVSELSVCSEVLPSAITCVLLLDDRLNALLALDTATGDRAVLSDSERGSGPSFSAPRSLVSLPVEQQSLVCGEHFPGSGACALVADSNLQAAVAVDLQTGDRQLVSSSEVGAGAELIFPFFLAYEPDMCQQALGNDNPCVFLTDMNFELVSTIFAVDLLTGDRSAFFTGGDISLAANALGAFTFDDENKRLIAIDQTYEALMTVDISSGGHVFTSWTGEGSGTPAIDD